MSRSEPVVFRSDQIESAWVYANPAGMVRSLLQKRELLWQFTLRAVQGRYRGSYLGLVWGLLTPLCQLAVFAFVFTMILPVSVPGVEGILGYALFLFTGLIAFNVFSESATIAPAVVTTNQNLVKKVIFPLELLPASLVGAALFHSLLSLVILLIGLVISEGRFPWTLVFLPLVYLPLILLSVGIGWFLAALGVFLRDIGNFVAVAVNLLFFLTPILYSIEAVERVPEALREYVWYMMWFNPLASIVVEFRQVVIWGEPPDWIRLAIITGISGLVALAGYVWFMKLKRAFADAI